MKWLSLHIVLLFLLTHSHIALAQDFGDTTTLESITNSDSEEIDENSESPDEEETEDTNKVRTISEEKWKKIKEDKDFIYKKESKKERKTKTYNEAPLNSVGNFFNAGLFKALMFIVVGILLVLILFHLFANGENSFFYKRKNKSDTGEESYENIEVFSEWDLALKNALAQNNYRLAVRVLYLETLQKLYQLKWIQYEQENTNWDYVAQLSGSTHQPSFTTLTKYFDYIWYGSFTIDREKYQVVENLYRKFQQEIL